MQGEVRCIETRRNCDERRTQTKNDPLVRMRETSAVPMQTKSVTRKSQMMRKTRNLDDTRRGFAKWAVCDNKSSQNHLFECFPLLLLVVDNFLCASFLSLSSPKLF